MPLLPPPASFRCLLGPRRRPSHLTTVTASPQRIPIVRSVSPRVLSSARSSPRQEAREWKEKQQRWKKNHAVNGTTTATTAFVPNASIPTTSQSPHDEAAPETISYTGNNVIPVTSKLHIVTPEEDTPRGKWPIFRLMDEDGAFRNGDGTKYGHSVTKPGPPVDLATLRSFLQHEHPSQAEHFGTSGLLHESKINFPDTNSNNTLLRAHRQMIRLREMDDIFHNAQRQGRISFYLTCTGEEAIHMGAASALDTQDHVFAQYREQGVIMWRGFTLEQFANQCCTNDLDLGKGRQMPIHYGSRALNYHTVSSPLGTQLPQAVGAAYRLKLQGKPNVAIAFFGDGCASTTDFHAALNFASTLNSPVIFFCRNNGYAISTPVTEQYKGDGVVARAPGYGMAAIRVDGNDLFAVHAATQAAKAYALEHHAPVLVEAMTYRLGHHSTSDDSTQYRSKDEIDAYAERMDPLVRLNKFLTRLGYVTDEDLQQMRAEERKAVLTAIQRAEKRPMPAMETLFDDVYHDVPKHLQEQFSELKDHIQRENGAQKRK